VIPVDLLDTWPASPAVRLLSLANSAQMKENPRNRGDRFLVLTIVAIFVIVGLAGLAIFSTTERSFARVFGAGSLLAGGAFVSGALVGLLFGIPRTPQSAADDASPGSKFLATNSNLIQVSDWLTKVLLGASLTQVTKSPAALASFGDHYGAEVGGPTLAVFLLMHFLVTGFLSGYLFTRVFLQHAFHRADTPPDAAKDESLLALGREEQADPSPPAKQAAASDLHGGEGEFSSEGRSSEGGAR
jgi:hypothetical protein